MTISSDLKPRPHPAALQRLPVDYADTIEAGLDIITVADRHAFGLATYGNSDREVKVSALLSAGGTRADAQLAAVAALLEHPDLAGKPVNLTCVDQELCTALKELRGAFAHLEVYRSHRRCTAGFLAVTRATAAARAKLTGAGIRPHQVHVATDGSYGRFTRRSGWGWVTSTGLYDCGSFKGGDPLTAELTAIRRMLRAFDDDVPMTVTCDSTDALAAIRDAQRSATPPNWLAVGPQRLAAEIAEAMTGRSVTLSWVRGHSGDVLNEGADRLAVHGRRAVEAELTAPVSVSIAKRIAAEVAGAYAAGAGPQLSAAG